MPNDVKAVLVGHRADRRRVSRFLERIANTARIFHLSDRPRRLHGVWDVDLSGSRRQEKVILLAVEPLGDDYESR